MNPELPITPSCPDQPVRLRTLTADDTNALMDFELRERSWFETWVQARGDAFYTFEGLAQHISECLAKYRVGTMHPMLVLDQRDQILGRVNLKDIDLSARTSELGYRLAQSATGKGFGKMIVGQAINIAKTQWRLHKLEAYVWVENKPSARVLESSGFLHQSLIHHHSELGGKPIDCNHYVLKFEQ